MSQRRQVSACSDRSFLGDHGTYAPVEQGQQMLNGLKTDAGMPPGKILDPQRHRGPNRLFIQRFSDTGGVTHQNIFLQTPGILLGNGHITQGAKTRGNTINGLLIFDPFFNQSAGCTNSFFGAFRQFSLGTTPGNGRQVGQGHTVKTKRDCFHI